MATGTAGMSVGDVSHLLEISESTVQREWRVAKAWLYRELANGDAPDPGEDG